MEARITRGKAIRLKCLDCCCGSSTIRSATAKDWTPLRKIRHAALMILLRSYFFMVLTSLFCGAWDCRPLDHLQVMYRGLYRITRIWV